MQEHSFVCASMELLRERGKMLCNTILRAQLHSTLALVLILERTALQQE